MSEKKDMSRHIQDKMWKASWQLPEITGRTVLFALAGVALGAAMGGILAATGIIAAAEIGTGLLIAGMGALGGLNGAMADFNLQHKGRVALAVMEAHKDFSGRSQEPHAPSLAQAHEQEQSQQHFASKILNEREAGHAAGAHR
jgi:predicted phosphoribosyltransferase